MPKSIHEAVCEICLSFPEAEEVKSHGSPGYRVRGKFFAYYTVNHHGDGRVALLVNAPPGMQAAHVNAEPRHYFIPPYVGPRGWLGIMLDKGISWRRVADHVRQAYEMVAPRKLSAAIGDTIRIEAPVRKLPAHELDPLSTPQAHRVLESLRGIAREWPLTSEGVQFGHPVWRVGKRVFMRAFHHDGALKVLFWVGVAAQGLMTNDQRYTVPPYFGPNGWIALDVSKRSNARELRALALDSYRHSAGSRVSRLLAEPLAGHNKKAITAKPATRHRTST